MSYDPALPKARSGTEINERHACKARDESKSRAQQRNATAVRALQPASLVSPSTSAETSCAPAGSSTFMNGLRMIAHAQRDFGQRSSFDVRERGDSRALGDCRKHVRIEKLSPLELQLRRVSRATVVTKRRLQRKMRKRSA